jgi:hypothetical protein
MKQHDYKTPFATLYYTDARGGLPVAVGACRSPGKANPLRNAKRSTAAQVFAEERYRRAEVVDRRTGLLVMALTRTTDGKINVNLDCAGQEARGYQWREKMADKTNRRKAGAAWRRK